MARVHLKYKIYAERSVWSNRWIWQACVPGEITGRPFDTWTQAAMFLVRAHEQCSDDGRYALAQPR